MRGRMTQTTQANQDSMLLFCIIFPVMSAAMAVRAAIVQEFKSGESAEEA
jgi:hypothetical protein